MKNVKKYFNVIGDDGHYGNNSNDIPVVTVTETTNSTPIIAGVMKKEVSFVFDNIRSGKFYNYQTGKSIDIRKPEMEKSLELANHTLRLKSTSTQFDKALVDNPSLDKGKWLQSYIHPQIERYVTARRKAEAKKQAELDALKNKLADAQKQLAEAQKQGKPTTELETKVAETNTEITKVENTPVEDKPNKMKYVYIGGAIIGVLVLGYFGWKYFIKKK